VRQLAGEDPTDELFGLAPEGFVAARDALARRLRRAGDAEAAAGGPGRRRPPLSAWAVNQLARRRGPELAPLLAGGREAVAGLVEAAVALLREAGRPATAATRARVPATLEAAAADPAAAELVRRGRLTADLGPAGDGDGPAAGRRPRRRPARDDPAARARRSAAVAARDDARRRARLAADQAVLATRQAERLGRLADQAEREAARARATAGAAIEAASAARERAARAARELHDAEDRIPGDADTRPGRNR
jgi:hypothetical protein